MRKPEKILIGCPTYSKQEYCLPEFCRSLQRLTYQNKDILFVVDEKEYQKKIQQQGFNCDCIPQTKTAKVEIVIDKRNAVRKRFLEGDYTHLLFLDTDIIVQKDAIEELLATDKDIATGVYLVPKQFGKKIGFIPCVFDFYDEEKGGIPFPYSEDESSEKSNEKDSNEKKRKQARVMIKQELYPNLVKEICFAGLGYCLIKRKVLEAIEFRKEGESDEGGEDIAFFIDARKNGFQAFVNSKPGSLHMVYPKGRRENQLLLFKIKPKPMATAQQ